MEHSVYGSMLIALIFPFVVISLLFILAALVTRRLFIQGKPGIAICPLTIWLVLVVYFLVANGRGFIYPIEYFARSGRPQMMIIGQIDSIKPGPKYPIYFDTVSKEFCCGEFITIKESTYFFPGTTLQKGQWVKLKYITQDRVICTWQVLSNEAEKAQQVTENAIVENLPPLENITQDRFAHILWYTSLAVLLILISFQYSSGVRIAETIFRRDSQHKKGIHPSGMGLLMWGNLAPFWGMMISWRIHGNRSMDYMMTLLGAIFMVVFFSKRTSHVEFSEGLLTVSKWMRSQTYTVSEIRSVEWRQTSIPYCRRLDIKLFSGTVISYEQEFFWGLSFMYQNLNDAINKQKSTNTER